MSYCEIISFKDGVVGNSLECSNSWGGAARIWSVMFDRYMKDPAVPFDSWLSVLSSPTRSKILWGLADRQDLPIFERVVYASTFDYAIVFSKDFKTFADYLDQFAKAHPAPGACHLMAWNDFVLSCEGEAIGFYGTSVGENLWNPFDEEKDCHTPYDLNTGTKHFDVFERIRGE